MESSRKLSDIDPRDRTVVERVFGQRIVDATDAVLILRTADDTTKNGGIADTPGVPDWCDVLRGLSDQELADFNASLGEPVRLAR